MKTVYAIKCVSKVLADRPPNNVCQKTPMGLIRWVSLVLICGMILVLTMPQSATAEENLQTMIEMMKKNASHLKSFFTKSQAEAIRNITGAARAIYFAPEVTTGGFLVGLQKGKGIILRRHGQEWSDPVFLSLSEYSVGVQAGIKESALIMLIMTDKAVDDLVNGLQKVGGSGGFAPGNWGIGASGAGGVHGGLEVLIVTTAKGAFLGGGLADVKMSEMKELNQEAYGKDYEKGQEGSRNFYNFDATLHGPVIGINFRW